MIVFGRVPYYLLDSVEYDNDAFQVSRGKKSWIRSTDGLMSRPLSLTADCRNATRVLPEQQGTVR